MIRGRAYAKANLGIHVGARRADGFHPIDGIFQSIDLTDELALHRSEVDLIESTQGLPVPDGIDNLAWRAVTAVRAVAGSSQQLRMSLDKAIPVAAGLGGGSADAAAALAVSGRYLGVGLDKLRELAPSLGSDVPFCLQGGTARVAGRGDEVTPLEALDGFAIGLVVPPFEVATAKVFSKWDELEQPTGLQIGGNDLPPSLRAEDSIVNDLYPAAVALAPEIDEWRIEVERRWARPVMLSGSGPTLFGFFVDSDEASDAVSAIPAGARLAAGCDLSSVGWRIE